MTSTAPFRTALVTGSTSGIGAAIACALAEQGWRVVVTGRDQTRGDVVVSEIERAQGQAVFVPSDLSAPPDALRAFARAALDAAGGHLGAIVHNAALCTPVDTVSLTDADLDATLAVNVRAPHVLTAALAPAMAERDDGAIVVIGSWMAHVGHAFVGLYSATKRPRSNWPAAGPPSSVLPASASTPSPREPPAPRSMLTTATSSDQMTAGTPAGRPGTPEEVAAAVTWLLSDHAAYIHGAEIRVDGGITATR